MDQKQLIEQLTALVNATDLDERSIASIQTLLVHTLRALEHAATEPTDMNHFARIVGPHDTPNDPYTRRICTGPLHLLMYIREDVVGELVASARRDEQMREFVRTGITANDYQKACATTAMYPNEHGRAYTALGLCGEAGEFAERVKKELRGDFDTGTVDDLAAEMDKRKKELGDVLWYAAMAAHEHGWLLSEVMQHNLDKLATRKAKGTLQGDGSAR